MDSHSSINSYPIDFNKFPLSKDVEFHEYIIGPNEYLFIPTGWFHWIFSEPYTFAITHVLPKNMEEKSDSFYRKMSKNLPFTGKKDSLPEFDMKLFLTTHKDTVVRGLVTNSTDSSPVDKLDGSEKSRVFDTIENIVNKDNIDHTHRYYMGMLSIEKLSVEMLIPYADINNIIVAHGYKATNIYIWLSLSKEIDSGLHYDGDDRILHVLSGRKRILLASPKYKHKLYVKTHSPISGF